MPCCAPESRTHSQALFCLVLNQFFHQSPGLLYLQSSQPWVFQRVPSTALRDYDNCTHYIRLHGARRPAFDILSGILQGCPMSGSLFCIISDPFLRLILSRFSYSQLWPTTTFSAYLDDLAFVLSRLFPQLALLLDMFNHFAEGAGPHLNFAKCVIIPSWGFTTRTCSLYCHTQCSFTAITRPQHA